MNMIQISKQEYDRLIAAAELLDDIQTYDAAKTAVEHSNGEAIPHDFMKTLVNADSPLRAWREYRGLSQYQLADRADVNRVQIIDIEKGKSNGSIATMKKLAAALNVTLDDIC